MNADFKEFKRVAEANDVIFFFSGYFTQSVITTSVETIKSRLARSKASSATQRRLLSAFIELSQNVIHYSGDAATDESEDVDEMRFGTLCITEVGEHFGIMCANPIRAANAERLEKKLLILRDMTLEEIKAAYRKTLRSEGEEGSKGAGLGFLTVAKDASEPIEFAVETDPSWGSDLKVFYLKATI